MQAFSDAMGSLDFRTAALDGAVAGMQRFTESHFGLINIAADTEEAFDNLSESVKENGKTFDVTTEKGRANVGALEEVAAALDTKLAAAYVDANGSQEKFAESAGRLAADTLTRLQRELGLSDEQTAALAASLGLLPEDIETRYKLSGDEEAKLRIGLLQTAIENLPKDVQTQVTQKILVGDYQGALNVINTYYANNHATAHTDAAPPSYSDMQGVVSFMNQFFAGHPVRVPVRTDAIIGAREMGGTVGPNEIGVAGEAGPEFIKMPGKPTQLISGPTIVPTGTRVTSVRKTRQILARRPKLYASGTSQPAVVTAGAPIVNVAAPPILIKLDGRPVAALIGSTTAPAVRAAAMAIRAGRA
jgi:hypothetical protein